MPNTRRFLDLFFKRAAVVVRETYGETAYIDHTTEQITIRDCHGVLGVGASVREAMKDADRTVADQRNGIALA